MGNLKSMIFWLLALNAIIVGLFYWLTQTIDMNLLMIMGLLDIGMLIAYFSNN